MATGLRHSVQRLSIRLGVDSATDGELLTRFLMDREETAFARLVQRHGTMVLGTCRRVLGNATEADDAFQAVFVVLLRKARSFTNRVCIGNVLYGIAYYTALKARAMANKRKAKEAKAPAREPAADSTELAARLDTELARLPEKYREPVVLCELGGLSRKEAATKLGIPEGTISSRLATAHRMLAKRIGVASITALLASPVLAVPTELSAAAVQAVMTTAPVSVATIAYEVTKMMFLSKLKLGAAVLTGVILAIATGVILVPRITAADEKPVVKAPAPKKKEVTDAEKKLYGKWVSVKMTHEPEIKQVVAMPVWTWTFDEKGLHTEATILKETHTGENSFEVDDTAKPKELTVIGKDGATRLQCIYELDGDTLKVGMYGIAEKARPSAFTAKDDKPKQAGALCVIEFKREKSDIAKLQGPWRCDGLSRLGTAIPTICWANLKIEKDTASFPGDPFKRGFTFTLNEKATPKEMIITGAKHIGQREKTYAIYEFDGDLLRISVNEGDKKTFPTDFDSKATNANYVYDFKRVPPDKADKIVDEPVKLYTDEEIRKLAKHDIDKESAGGRDILGVPCLDVVPAGESHQRAKVFETLKIEDSRICDFRASEMMSVVFLTWRVSPSYDICCMSATNDRSNSKLELTDPKRKVYGIRLLKRVVEKKDEELIQGLWEAETAQVRGKQVPAGDVYKVLRMRFKGNTVTTITEDGEGSQAFTLDTTTSPKKLATHPVGKPKEKKDYAIYDLDGDMLKLCHNTDEGDAGPLPTSFRAGSQDKDELIVLKRVKDEPKKEEAKKPDEPTWKTEFRKAYGLTDGQMVRRIAPPYPDCRAEYFRDMIRQVYKQSKLEPNDEAVNRDYTNHFTKFGWKDGWMKDGHSAQRVPVKPEEGTSLDYVIDVTLGVPQTRIIGFEELKTYKVTGDFVVRVGADQDKLVEQLEKILREECKLPVKFSFKDVEEEVLVLSGKYKANPLNEAKPNLIEVFANFRGMADVGGGGTGSLKELTEALERHVSKPVLLGKIDGEPKKLEWHYQHRPMGFTEQQYNEDHDAGIILKNIATQTGLTVTTEKKNLRMLVIEKKELGK
jgi:RNA polymerase sigma factor (sigma-70 family)